MPSYLPAYPVLCVARVQVESSSRATALLWERLSDQICRRGSKRNFNRVFFEEGGGGGGKEDRWKGLSREKRWFVRSINASAFGFGLKRIDGIYIVYV